MQLLVGHTPLHTNLLTSSRLGCGQLVNLRERDDLSTMDKSPAPNASTVQRFHCITGNRCRVALITDLICVLFALQSLLTFQVFSDPASKCAK